MQERALDGRQTFCYFAHWLIVYIYTFKTTEACFGRVVNTVSSKILHFRICTFNCSNSSRILEPSRTLLNPCSQKTNWYIYIMLNFWVLWNAWQSFIALLNLICLSYRQVLPCVLEAIDSSQACDKAFVSTPCCKDWDNCELVAAST